MSQDFNRSVTRKRQQAIVRPPCIFMTLIIGSVMGLSTTALTSEPVEFTGPLPCKYSVRDVGFVNVHGNSWQLELVSPEDLNETSFSDLNNTIRQQLDRTNVDLVWIDGDPLSANPSSTSVGDSPKNIGRIVGRDETFELDVAIGHEVEDLIELVQSITQSEARERILDASANSLCAVVLFCGKDESANEAATKLVDEAVQQIEKQLWTMEKPTENSAVRILITAEQVDEEDWLMRSLGINPSELPVASIIFGQGRQLGDPLSGDQLTQDNLISRVTICGHDCECDLDRDWLYGKQFIHHWSMALERTTEKSLDFDPHSALVVAEVANIIRKNSGNRSKNADHVRLGSGLIIHDLSEMESGESANEAARGDDGSLDSSENDSLAIEPESRNSDSEYATDSEKVRIPFLLIIGLAIVVAAVSFIVVKRKN